MSEDTNARKEVCHWLRKIPISVMIPQTVSISNETFSAALKMYGPYSALLPHFTIAFLCIFNLDIVIKHRMRQINCEVIRSVGFVVSTATT